MKIKLENNAPFGAFVLVIICENLEEVVNLM